MNTVIDADTHISEGEAMWQLLEPEFLPRRPIMLKVPRDTWYGNRDAFWLIDGVIYPKPAGRGSFALVTPSAQSVQAGRKDSTVGTREMTDIKSPSRGYEQVEHGRANRLSDPVPGLQHQRCRAGVPARSRLARLVISQLIFFRECHASCSRLCPLTFGLRRSPWGTYRATRRGARGVDARELWPTSSRGMRGSRGPLRARRTISIDCAGSERLLSAHKNSSELVISMSSSTTTT
jgi:hypothetical protein